MPELFLNNSIEIHARTSIVWKILIQPRFIQQWSDLPVDFEGESDFSIGSEIQWKNKEEEVVKGIVITLEPEKLLRISLYDPTWNRPVAPEYLSYTYTVSNKNSRTLLSFHFGDFAKIPNSEKKYEEAMVFERKELQKIKELAEKQKQV